ncbi:MAG: hypothetical protein U9N87_11630 [Planctomycetota bacterium]|nr:hypothetical protein [Planctomycetota bacterium]
MRKTLISTLFVGLLLGGLAAGQAAAADAKPMATIAFSGYDNLMTDVECIGKLAGSPDLVKTLEDQLTMMTQGKGLAGLDKKRPWGLVILPTEAPMPTGYGFIPVTKLADLMAVVGTFPGMEISDAGDGVSEINGPKDNSLFIKQQGDWAYICLNKEGFADVAADPAKLLGDSATKYNLCVRLLFKNIPSSLREMAMGLIQMGMAAGQNKLPGESDENFAMRMKVAQDSIKQTEKVLAELDTVMVGINIDEKTGQAHIDIEQTAIAGTDLAKQMATVVKGKTAFGGFYQADATLTACTLSAINKTQQEQMKNTLVMYHTMLDTAIDEQELSDEEAAKAKQLMGDVMKIIEDTIAMGKVDMGLALSLASAKSTLIAGGNVADGKAVDKLVRDLAKIAAAEQPEAAKLLKLDAAEHANIKFHAVAIPLPAEIENRDKIVGIIGEELTLTLGVGDKQVYLGIGADALEKLKAAIDSSKAQAGADVPPMRMSIAAKPIAKLVGDLAENFPVMIAASAIASALEDAGSDDHITIVSEGIENGARSRITMQKGILKVLGTLPSMAGGGM